MYKVGDEVLIKGEVLEVMNDVPYPVKVRLGSDNSGLVFSNDEVCYADKIVKTYTQGLADAWELAKKIYDMNCENVRDIFEKGFWEIIHICTAEEALAKIEAYEEEKEIKVGDVVNVCGISKGVIVNVVDGSAHILWKDGNSGTYSKNSIEKTGKHIDIESLLRQIGE